MRFLPMPVSNPLQARHAPHLNADHVIAFDGLQQGDLRIDVLGVVRLAVPMDMQDFVVLPLKITVHAPQ